MIKIAVLFVVLCTFIVAAVTGYVKNVIKLAECDFQAPYKAEVMHAVGIIPPIGMFTGYMDFGK